MDYSIWSILEVNACVTSHAKVEAPEGLLEDSVGRSFPERSCVPPHQLMPVEGSERRLEAVARAEGGHIA